MDRVILTRTLRIVFRPNHLLLLLPLFLTQNLLLKGRVGLRSGNISGTQKLLLRVFLPLRCRRLQLQSPLIPSARAELLVLESKSPDGVFQSFVLRISLAFLTLVLLPHLSELLRRFLLLAYFLVFERALLLL